jgi:hypothetical protein
MAIIRLNTNIKNAALVPIRDGIDGGSGPGVSKIYAGTIPADINTAIGAQTLLGTVTFSDPCGTIASGALTMNAITQDSSADNSGTASFTRIFDSSNVAIMDLDISTVGGGGAMQMNTTNIVALGPILVASFVITMP